jgi:hypothetical protein
MEALLLVARHVSRERATAAAAVCHQPQLTEITQCSGAAAADGGSSRQVVAAGGEGGSSVSGRGSDNSSTHNNKSFTLPWLPQGCLFLSLTPHKQGHCLTLH